MGSTIRSNEAFIEQGDSALHHRCAGTSAGDNSPKCQHYAHWKACILFLEMLQFLNAKSQLKANDRQNHLRGAQRLSGQAMRIEHTQGGQYGCQIILQHKYHLLFARNGASDAMLLRNTSCRYSAACTGTSLNSLWRVANCVILECVWSMLKQNTCHRCPWDLFCLALCNCCLQLISVLALQRQNLDADTLALFMCLCAADTSIGILNMLMFPCESMTLQALICDYNHHP